MTNPNTDPIPFARPSIGPDEEEAVLRVLRSGWLTTASEAIALEKEFAAAVGSRYAIAVSSGTAGLHLSLESLGISQGDKVVTTPYTFTSSAEVARYLGAEPVFVDVNEHDLNMDVDLLEETLSSCPDARAVIPVHVGGHPCQMAEISEACRSRNVSIVEDAAHAFPGTLADKPLGTFGDTGVFSFYATKTMTTGEGGMIVTDRDDLARRTAVMRLHGIDREVWNRYTSTQPSWQYEIVAAGFKYNLPDLLAAIGRVQLRRASEFNTRRRDIANRYLRLLEDRDYLRLPPVSNESSWHLFIIRLQPDRLTIGRDEFISKLAKRGIGTSVHYIPLHLMPYYRDRYGLRPEDYPVSLKAYESAISLPIYPDLSDDAVERIAREVIQIGDDSVRH